MKRIIKFFKKQKRYSKEEVRLLCVTALSDSATEACKVGTGTFKGIDADKWMEEHGL
jgi:hypothetical protein